MWQVIDFPDTIINTSIGRNNQIKKSEIQSFGQYPVIDQGQAFIAGYTNEESKVITDNLPLVIFGDHTRCFKYVDFPFVIGADGTKVIKPNPELFDTKYYYFALLSLEIPNRGYNRHFTLLKEKKVPKPELTEQCRIAYVLTTVQTAIEQQTRLIELTRELKSTLMRKLFTDGLRGEKLKKTEIGLVPESWEVGKIGDYCQSSAFGPRFSSNLYSTDGNILTLRTTDLDDDGNIDYREAPKANLELARFEGHLLHINDVVVSRSGTCGIAAVFEGYDMPVLPGAFLIRLRLTNRINPQYLRYYINSPIGRPRIMTIAQGAIQKNISGTSLKNFEIPVPKLDEQKEISAHVETLNQKVRLHESKKRMLEKLFRTLLHQLMTAQIRVNDRRHRSWRPVTSGRPR